MPSVLVVGGTGLLGRAVARRMLAHGWAVTVTGRDPGRLPPDLAAAGTRFLRADRDEPDGAGALATAVGDGVDLLVDCACYTAAHAGQLLPLAARAGSTVLMSSRAVYVDDAGRHVNSAERPRFAGPVTEQQPTLAPGTAPYDSPEGYGPNKVAAEQVLLDSGLPVTVLRPSKVHGEGAAVPRTWWFVRCALDRRPVVLLAGRGAGSDPPSAAANVAALVHLAAQKPGRRVLNVADPDAPDGLAIARAVANLAGHHPLEVLLDDDAPPDLGRHPWHAAPPIVLDTTAAQALGHQPVGDFATTVAEEVDWLLRRAAGGRRTALDADPAGWFDYAAEDAYLAARAGHRRPVEDAP